MKALNNCYNFFGPLSPEIQGRIKAYLDNPTEEGWDDVHGIIIQDTGLGLTLWQAWIAIDSTAPVRGPKHDMQGRISKWVNWPDSFTLRRAIKAATGG